MSSKLLSKVLRRHSLGTNCVRIAQPEGFWCNSEELILMHPIRPLGKLARTTKKKDGALLSESYASVNVEGVEGAHNHAILIDRKSKDDEFQPSPKNEERHCESRKTPQSNGYPDAYPSAAFDHVWRASAGATSLSPLPRSQRNLSDRTKNNPTQLRLKHGPRAKRHMNVNFPSCRTVQDLFSPFVFPMNAPDVQSSVFLPPYHAAYQPTGTVLDSTTSQASPAQKASFPGFLAHGAVGNSVRAARKRYSPLCSQRLLGLERPLSPATYADHPSILLPHTYRRYYRGFGLASSTAAPLYRYAPPVVPQCRHRIRRPDSKFETHAGSGATPFSAFFGLVQGHKLIVKSLMRSLDLHDRGMCAHFCDVVHAMTEKTPGLVVLITYSGHLCVVERCYVAQWPRSHQPPDDSNPLHRLAQNTKLKAPTPLKTPARFGFRQTLLVGHQGHRAESIEVYSTINLAEISAVHPAAPGQSFTLVKLDYEHMHWELKIGCHCDLFTKTWGSYEQLNAILPHLHLPSLKKIHIGITIHPMAFTQFFRNNNGITQIELEGVPSGEQPRDEMLTEHPVVLPKLEYLSCLGVEDLVPLLNSFTLPDHTTIAIPFDPFADAHALRRSLRRLAQQPLSVNLILRGKFTSWGGFRKPFNDEDLIIAGTLDCVTWLHVEVYSDNDMRALLPWLACFPQLETLCGTPDSWVLLLG
ncbi:hypothetical protein C8R47DRAFT_1303437 [Mycena vitilis]|nr:hypothetical protein C8R47DRAFT_1303437 [Mycena vitilis]